MGLLVDGVSLFDSGEWVLRIQFGLRWVAVPFEVWSKWSNILNIQQPDLMVQVIVDNKTSISPSLRPTSNLPMHVKVKKKNWSEDSFLTHFTGKWDSPIDIWCDRIRVKFGQSQTIHFHCARFNHVQLGPRFTSWFKPNYLYQHNWNP